jgi:hypothetical protein
MEELVEATSKMSEDEIHCYVATACSNQLIKHSDQELS